MWSRSSVGDLAEVGEVVVERGQPARAAGVVAVVGAQRGRGGAQPRRRLVAERRVHAVDDQRLTDWPVVAEPVARRTALPPSRRAAAR